MNDHGNMGEYLVTVGKVLPPIAVTGVSITGLSLQDWVYILTIAYTSLQIISTVWKWYKNKTAA